MAWHFPQSGTTSPTLVDDDDVFIAQQVFLNGVINSGVTDGHEVIVAGTVASYGDAIVLGFYPGGGPNSVTVEATGQVRAFEGNSIRLFGDGQQIVNHGLIAQEASAIIEAVAVSFRSDGPLPATSSSFINTGIVNADGIAVYHFASETLTVSNSGTIASAQNSFVSNGPSKDLITNTGKMIGDAFLGEGDDLYDGRLGTIDGNVLGEVGVDKLYAGGGNSRLFGGDGNDTLMGGTGADYLSGGSGLDRASYASATKAVTVSLANPAINSGDATGDAFNSIENLSGSNYNDNVFGNAANNAINGGAGNDAIKGYTGNDTLTGHKGADIFIFNTALNAATNIDTITDLNRVDDTIHVDNALFIGLVIGALPDSAFKDIAISAKDASDRILYNSDTGNLYFDRDGSGGTYGAIKFASLAGSPTITAADFVVI
ncbi:calcium-binding protein [Mesorhizobium sp. IMUNJ 23232]|uniref:calcium-binding protein n=1 Tax=Mesorhizobium sp. IMUNJ 23232 TaxID=3376064 RepID=UPI0037AFBBE6